MTEFGLKSFKNLQPNTQVTELINYIEAELLSFTSSDEFVEILAKRKNENQHSAAFCVYMTNKCKSRFCFQRENAQKASSTVDIGVYRGAVLFFTIEAKVLPTPISKERKEHEYVYGNGGGIERFKNEKHGLDNKDILLPINGMIAYIKQENFEYWHSKINQWVLDASWPKSEKLEKLKFSNIARLKSFHKRKNGADLTLHHFWISVTQN